MAVRRSGLEVAVRCHAAKAAATLQGGLVEDLLWTGDWDAALALAVELEPQLEQRGELHELAAVRACRALILARRGRQAEALQPAAWAHRITEEGPDLETCLTSVFAVLVVRWLLDEEDVTGLLEDWIGLPAGVRGSRDYPLRLPQAARIASRLGRPDLIEALTADVRRDRPLDALATVAVQALVSEGCGDYRAAARHYGEAADGWSEFAVPHESAISRSAQSRCLAAAGQTAAADAAQRAADRLRTALGIPEAAGDFAGSATLR
jgi:ATP/maltotriose-dependent transcriptional regulator MalT